MGSFYALCSITNKTIVDGQKMVVQLMLPANRYNKVDSGNMFVDSFLRVAESDGLEKALSTWKQATQDWGSASELGEKGMIVSNETPCMSWVPFGPAIRGVYDDCGNIATDEDPENLDRIDLLEKILCAPFDSIMEAATDDRWYTIGIKRNDKGWQQEGLTSETPEFAMTILKQLSVTYMHAGAYDALKEFDFCSENGKMKSEYDIKWKNEYLDKAKKKLPLFVRDIQKIVSPSEDPMEQMKMEVRLYEMDQLGAPFRGMSREFALIYLASLHRENPDLEWYIDLPSWSGHKDALEMVMGADSFLTILAGGGDEVRAILSDQEIEGADSLILKGIGVFEDIEVDSGAWYVLPSYMGIDYNHSMWLCDVTLFVFWEFSRNYLVFTC